MHTARPGELSRTRLVTTMNTPFQDLKKYILLITMYMEYLFLLFEIYIHRCLDKIEPM